MFILRRLLALFRLTLIIMSTLVHATALGFFTHPRSKMRLKILKSWGWSLCAILGVRVNIQEPPLEGGAILICNHRSYVDIPLLMSIKPCIFLAKIEVRHLPVIGWAAARAYTVFVDRSDPESRSHSRETLRARLDQGLSVLVFSEGTTTASGTLAELKPGMFHEAEDAKLPVHCAFLEYDHPEAAWVGAEGIGPHFFRHFGRWASPVTVTFKQSILEGPDGLIMRGEATDWMRSCIVKRGSLKEER